MGLNITGKTSRKVDTGLLYHVHQWSTDLHSCHAWPLLQYSCASDNSEDWQKIFEYLAPNVYLAKRFYKMFVCYITFEKIWGCVCGGEWVKLRWKRLLFLQTRALWLHGVVIVMSPKTESTNWQMETPIITISYKCCQNKMKILQTSASVIYTLLRIKAKNNVIAMGSRKQEKKMLHYLIPPPPPPCFWPWDT